MIFFDEFDSDQKKWIKSFLMPMQDGKFKDESGEHPLGKCILVFAGGTSASFNEFTAPMISEDAMEVKDFKDVKGPDFVSRLKGTINILGPNPNSDTDNNYILRRALLLRSLCERKSKVKKKPIQISPEIIHAMLHVPKYKHGARSMEAIIDMSRIENNVLKPTSLPLSSQLSLHVDSEAFIKLVLRNVILSSNIEKLAIVIHADFCKKEIERGNKNAVNVVPWDLLSEDTKHSNRAQAAGYVYILHETGFDFDAGDSHFQSIKSFSKEEILWMSQIEHNRWMDNRIKAGYNYAPLSHGYELAKESVTAEEWAAMPEKDQRMLAIKKMREKMFHHLLVSWDELP